MRGRGRGRGSYSYSRGRGATGRGMPAAGSLHMTRTGSGSNSNNSIDDSNESEEGPRSPRGLMTSSVGGLDADNDRPAKLRRLSTQRSGQNIPPIASSGEGDSDEQAQYQGASFQDAVVDEADAEEDELAEAEDEAQDEKGDFDSDALPQSQDAGSSAPPKRGGWANRRGKRRKGWNLRKVNKIANGVPMQTTPLRAEDVPDRPVPGGILDRLPGRRRAAHPDANVEADLRRQLELKVAYRSVVKALKPILAELARRTTEELESNETAYQEPEEYEAIIAELDQRLADRLSILDAFFDEDKARFEREYEARQQIIKERYQNLWFDRQDDRLVEAQHEMMTIIREIEMEEDAEATEDEGGEILPVLYSKQPPQFQRIKLDKKFYPRGKFFVETDAAWHDLEVRRVFRDVHRESDPDSFIRHPKGFAVFDAEKRALATAKFNVVQLAEAGKEVELMAAKKAREEAYAQAAGFRAILEAAEMHATVPQTPAAPLHVKQQTPASANVKPIVDNFVVESGPFHRATMSPKSRGGQVQSSQSRGTDAPVTQHVNQPGMEYHQRMYPDQRQTHPERVAQGPVNGFILVLQQQDRAYGHSMYPPHPEQGQSTDNGQKALHGQAPGSGFIPPFSVAPAGSERQGKQRKRPGPRAHYAAQDNRQQPPSFQPQQGWSPFSNSMGPPMYIPDYIKGGEASQSPAEDPNSTPGPPTAAADSPALSQRKRSAKSTPQMGLQPLAPAHNRGPTPEGPAPGRASYGSPRLTSPRESTFHSGISRSESSAPLPLPPGKYEPASQQNQLPPFLQPLQPSPFQQSASYQGSYYPQSYYGSFSGPSGAPQHQHTASQDTSSRRDSKSGSEQSSRPAPPGGHPPMLLPHPGRDSFYSYSEQRQPAPQPPAAHSMMFRYNPGTPAPTSSTGAAPRRPRSTQQSQPLPPPPAASHPPILPSPSQFPTFNAGPPRGGPLPMPRQHPGQRLGSQTLLPATLDPSRHPSHPSDRVGGHSRNASRETEIPSRHSLSGPLNYPPHPPSHQPASQQHQDQFGSPRSRSGDGQSQRPGSVQPRLPSLGAHPGYPAAPPPPPPSSGQSPASQHAWPGFAPPSGPPQFAWQTSTHGSSWGLPGPPGPPGTAFGSPSGVPLSAHGAGPPPKSGVHGGADAADSASRDQSLPPRAVKRENSVGSVREREIAPSGDVKRGE